MSTQQRDRSSPSFGEETRFASEIDSFLDFDNNNSFLAPNSNIRSSFSSSSASSAQSTPTMRQAHPSSSGFPAPSHPYNLHPQQTDLLGLDVQDGGFFGDSTTSEFMRLDADVGAAQQPAYFFPETTAPPRSGADSLSQGISPMMTIGEMNPQQQQQQQQQAPPVPVAVAQPQQPQQPQRMQYYPGYHQQMYQENMRLQQQKLARQKAAATAMPKAPSHPRQGEIDAILDSFRISSSPINGCKNSSDILPHIARMKKEEEDMDEDERLLASEEGKKLSSKERRQLRNKVSARAFRSRRKEYISQLEAEVAKKTQEAEAVKEAHRRLEEENTRLRSFSEMLMKHSAFQEFLKDLSAPLINQPTVSRAAVTVAPAAVAEPLYNSARDANPNVSAEEQWPLAYATTWNNSNNLSHVYNVELPSGPAVLQDLDGKGVCGAVEEDYTIADGFFSGIRDTKGDIDYNRMDEDEDSYYQAPDNLEDVYLEEEQSKQNLDDLFPGVGVNDFLEKLEMVAGGEARPEDVFEMETPDVPEPRAVAEAPRRCATVNKSNHMLKQAEGVYRRIGLSVGGSQ
ncbi:hypothetical protein BZA05DRAFT_376811 [Tricharina praecox]|uniref:uncharacterized protein n=1 Tax=Tricharina praecox TaxID=43433 RepID=UPI00221FDE88|nr:uncharacterized protein BZA05DRAFT_376811 [Tricharina praecox]KAI5847603.1 hypothetical protein BZA05DRAFT_376811 [Tricharina praecox]